jgi:RecA-family ATPase
LVTTDIPQNGIYRGQLDVTKIGSLNGKHEPRLLTVAELEQLADLEWLIDGILPADRLALLWGQRNTFKTFIALDMALAIATGKPWQGRRTKPGSVLYISGEGQSSLGLRTKAWRRSRNVEQFAPNQVRFITDPTRFRNHDEVNRLLRDLEREEFQPRLVVVDTLARSFGGGEENGSVDMGQFIDGIELVRRTTQATVLVLHHPDSTNKKPRGHTSLEAAMDTSIRTKNASTTKVTLNCARQKEAEEFEDIRFDRKVIHLGDGKSSLVPVAQEQSGRQSLDDENSEDENAFADEVAKTQGRSTTTVTKYARTLEKRGLLKVELVPHRRTRKNFFVLDE